MLEKHIQIDDICCDFKKTDSIHFHMSSVSVANLDRIANICWHVRVAAQMYLRLLFLQQSAIWYKYLLTKYMPLE